MEVFQPMSLCHRSKNEARKGLIRWYFTSKCVQGTKDGDRRTQAETKAATAIVNMTLKRLSLFMLHVLCAILLIMCMDVETNPGPDDHYNTIVQVMDWRFSQILHGLQLHTATINRMLSDNFNKLDSTLSQLVSDVNRLKEFAQQGTDDIKNLQEDYCCILQRLDTLEQTVETTEAETKLCNLKFFGIPEPSERYGTTCEDQILDVLTEHSTRVWNYSDVKRAFRIGERRQHSEEPRPMVVQFQRWGDKMKILTDRELRDSLRREGVKVTSELTTKQRNVIDFYKQQGKIAFYKNGRLQISNKDTNKYQHRARFQYENHGQDSDDGYDEWPHPSHTQRYSGYRNQERGPNGDRRRDTVYDNQRNRREEMRHKDTDHQSRRNHTDLYRDRYREEDRQHTRSRGHVLRSEEYPYWQSESNTHHTSRPDKDKDARRWVDRGNRDKDTQRQQPYEHETVSLPSRDRNASSNPLHWNNDGNTRRRPANNIRDRRDDQSRVDGRKTVPGHRAYSEVVKSVPEPDSRLTTRRGDRHDIQQTNFQRRQSLDSTQCTETGPSVTLLQAPTDPAVSVPYTVNDHDTDIEIDNTEGTVGGTADEHMEDRQIEDRRDGTLLHHDEREYRQTDDRHTEDDRDTTTQHHDNTDRDTTTQYHDNTDRDTTTQHHDNGDRVQCDTEHETNNESATQQTNMEEAMPDSEGPVPEEGLTSTDRRQTAVSCLAGLTSKNSDTESGNPLDRARATARSKRTVQARSGSRSTRALRSDNNQKRALSQSSIADAFKKRLVNQPVNTKDSEGHTEVSASTAPRDKNQ